MIDYTKLAADATVASDAELPTTGHRFASQPSPFVDLVTKAVKDGKRYDLPGRFSLVPYEGRKNACEAFTVTNELHKAARQIGTKVQVRRLDPTTKDTGLTFKVTATK